MRLKHLKKSLSGLETEFFLLKEDGNLLENATQTIHSLKKEFKELGIVSEAGLAQIEIASYPKISVGDTSLNLLEKTLKVIEFAEEKNLIYYPYAMYPGKLTPSTRKKTLYNALGKVFGKERLALTGLANGFHYHYTLPRGVFDSKTKNLKPIPKSRFAKSMVDSYNLAIALDPVLISLMQCTPFLQGRHLAKDCRLLLNREGKSLDSEHGLYYLHPSLGELPKYEHSIRDIAFAHEKRFESFKQLLEEQRIDSKNLIKPNKVLRYSWNPVRINRLGTLEIRTMDMTNLKYVIAMTTILKFVFRNIQQEFTKVVVSETGYRESFKIEDNKLHIPPYTIIKNELQKKAVYQGLSNKDVYEYTKNFWNRLAKTNIYSEYNAIVKPVYEMIKKRENVSDKILKKIKRKQIDLEKELPQKTAQEIALKISKNEPKEIEKLKEKIENLE